MLEKAGPLDSQSSRLPKVSIVIVNYNYSRYLEDALASASNQTYQNIEVMIIDDVSSDESWSIIQSKTCPNGPYPHVDAYRMPENGGHALAATAGFLRTTGCYIVFLDADDVLMPDCVEAHVYAHMSSRVAIGFSSVDAYCWSEGQWITTTFGSDRAAYIASRKGLLPNMVRPIDKAAPAIWSHFKRPSLSVDEIHFVPAPLCEWLWSPMSGNCFRRDALEPFLKGPELANIRNGFDAYLMHPISSLNGSVLIDRPLMAYRIHKTNVFIKSAPLARMLTYDTKLATDFAPKTAVAKTFNIVNEFGDVFEQPDFFFQAVESQCHIWPGLKADHGGKDFLAECLVKHRSTLSKAFGEPTVSTWLKRGGAETEYKRRWWEMRWLSIFRSPNQRVERGAV